MSKFTNVRDAIIGFIKTESQKVVDFLQPTIAVLKPQLRQFAYEDLSLIVARAAQCISDGKGEACALDAAVGAVKDIAGQQGQQLAHTAAVSIAANLVQKAKDSLAGPPVNQ